MRATLLLPFLALRFAVAEPEFPLTADSKPQTGAPKGSLIEDVHIARADSVFPGTERAVKIYLPPGFDREREWPFMVFQDGVIYQAPVVFDNLIHKKDIPPLVGIFIKPGVVPAANDNALPRFNRSYEYDSVTDTYSHFLIDELLPALEAKYGLKLSADPNQAAIAGNSSGGICAFMVAWHRPDRFRRVFTGVGTYVGIRGADRLPVLIRKIEPKPLRVFLQSGTGDNDLYCGDWWMANQMMQRSLAWAGYDVNHAWGEGGHNQKHATQVFPDALRWLWRDWQTDIEVKANPKGESKWRGYEMVSGDEKWRPILGATFHEVERISSSLDGSVRVLDIRFKTHGDKVLATIHPDGKVVTLDHDFTGISAIRSFGAEGAILYNVNRFIDKDGGMNVTEFHELESEESVAQFSDTPDTRRFSTYDFIVRHDGMLVISDIVGERIGTLLNGVLKSSTLSSRDIAGRCYRLTFSPDQTTVYGTDQFFPQVSAYKIDDSGEISAPQVFAHLDAWPATEGRSDGSGSRLESSYHRGLCVDTEGRLYVATSLGIQVCDQAGRVNFIIPTPASPYDVCFGGKDLSELFIACGNTIYKRPTKVKGYISGQMAPIKPAPPKL